MTEPNRMRRRASSLLLSACLALAGCTLDTHATGRRGAPELEDAGFDGSFDRGVDEMPVEEPEDAGQDASPALILDAGHEGDAGHEMDAAPSDAGAHADAQTDAGSDADVEGPLSDGGYPELLSQTGLYQSIQYDVVRGDVMSFQPHFVLWSDGAIKRRWLRLPVGKQIDTSDMDAWNFPVGTKAWKEFRVDGVRVETRMLHKAAEDRWVMVAYRWRADQRDADAVPAGQANALGTAHDIPDQTQCVRCHNSQGVLLGVSALQLSHDLSGRNLMSLAREGRLSKPPAANFKIPGGTLAENALGYLHANCGHCHRPGTTAYEQILKRGPRTGGPIFWERTDKLDTLEHTLGYSTTVLQPNSVLPDLHIIEPGYPDKSEMVIRASQRGEGTLQMPPIGTEVADETGLKQVKDWITSLKK
ncbi:MAG: hypothetical protein QM778_29705 [Myxococcales bacterium]